MLGSENGKCKNLKNLKDVLMSVFLMSSTGIR